MIPPVTPVLRPVESREKVLPTASVAAKAHVIVCCVVVLERVKGQKESPLVLEIPHA
jgi:hypothetical protein